MGDKFGLTGTPGTGKKTLAPLVASKLRLQCISLNELAVSAGAQATGSPEVEIDVSFLKSKLPRMLHGPSLLYGHLLPYVIGRDFVRRVVVLRCEPSELKKRLVERGYSPEKVIENVEAELIGLLSSDSLKAFGKSKVLEYDTTPSDSAKASSSIAKMIGMASRPDSLIDWTLSYDTPSKLRSLLSAASIGATPT